MSGGVDRNVSISWAVSRQVLGRLDFDKVLAFFLVDDWDTATRW
jgi:hypothetical protein